MQLKSPLTRWPPINTSNLFIYGSADDKLPFSSKPQGDQVNSVCWESQKKDKHEHTDDSYHQCLSP